MLVAVPIFVNVSIELVQALTAASMKITAFWDKAPYSLVHRPDDGSSVHLLNVSIFQRD
jgi:hypothetical protein